MSLHRGLIGLAAILACAAGSAFAINNPEVEPNNSKGSATVANSGGIGMTHNDTITGVSTGSSTTVAGDTSADYFLVTTRAMPTAIYRYRMILTNGSGTNPPQSVTIRGLSQTAGVPNGGTDVAFQFGSSSLVANAKTVQWYGFGQQEQIYVRVTGTSTTTTPYTMTLERTLVDPATHSGPIVEGDNTIYKSTGNTSAMDAWVYDNNLNAIDGYGRTFATGASTAGLVRTFQPGTYYVAWGVSNTANNLGAPTDDTNRAQNLLDFPGAIASDSTLTIANADMAVNSFAGTAVASLSRNSAFEIPFVQMTVAVNDIPSNPSCAALVSPNIVINDGSGNIQLTADVTPGDRPASVNHTMTVDLSFIGGPADAVMIEGPANFFSYNYTVPQGTPAATYTITYNVEEVGSLGRRSTCTANITVQNPPTGSCCTTDGCLIFTEAECALNGGTYNGNNTTCAGCACADLEPPVNDAIDGAIALEAGVLLTGNTCGASVDNDAIVCGGQTLATGGVWFSLVGTGFDSTVELCGSNYDTRLSIFCGASGTLTCVGGNDDACGLSSRVNFCTQPGVTYYALVHGYVAASRGNFNIVYLDNGIECTPTVECVPTGACCLTDGCQRLTAEACTTAGGTYLGDGESCVVINDGFPSGDSFPVFIPDSTGGVPGTASATIVIGPGSGTVSNLSVRVGLTHTFCGDLIATIDNGSTSARLFNRTGAGNNLLGDYLFFDLAPVPFTTGAASGTPIPGGSYSPIDSLSVFDGQPYEGTWTLTITDNAGIDTGTIDAFSFSTLDTNPLCAGGGCAPCAADYNQDGGVTGDDVESFFLDFSEGLTCADVNLDGGVTGDDVETFFFYFGLGGC